MKEQEELVITSCGSRCVSACQPIVSSSRQMIEVLRTHQQTTVLEAIPAWHFARRLRRVGRCAVKGMLILAGANPVR